MSKFLANFRKTASKINGVSLDVHEPTFYLDSGNYIINKLIGESYTSCFPQGKLSAIAGPSATGKTYVASNCAKFALLQNIGVLYIDTENAIDKGHFEAIGIDPEHPLLQYAAASSISQVIEIVSTFLDEYRKAEETIPFLIVIDSLDMLQTDSDEKNYASGEIKGGQGQKEKQLKKMLAAFVHDIKTVPMHMLCTKQVYVNQDDSTKFIEPWKFTEALKFAFSQILLVTKLSLKDKATNEYLGFKLKAFGFKTRLTKPFQVAEIDVPYDTGMDRFTGLHKAAVSMGIIQQKGSWFNFGEHSYQGENNWTPYREAVLAEMIKRENESLNIVVEGEEETGEPEEMTPEQAREIIKKKFKK